jgi:hypothetical protein
VNDFNLVSVSVAGLSEVSIEAKKADHFTAPGASASSEGFEIAAGKWTNPAPVTTENVAQPGYDGILLLFTGEYGVGQDLAPDDKERATVL